MSSSSASFVWKPTPCSTTLPSFINNNVGILMTPNFPAVSWFSSTSNLTILTLSSISLSNSSRTGAIILQGPHHGAQKSAKTRPSAVSFSKSWSVTFIIAIFNSSNHSLTTLIISSLLHPCYYFAYQQLV